MSEISLQELCAHLDELLQIADFSDYCPNGLQVEGNKTVKTMATGVSASLETIKQAAEIGVDALIVHHGMFWKGDAYEVCGVKKEKLKLLIENGISLLGYHLPLDAHQQYGNNWKVASDLKWTNTQACGIVNGMPTGVYGEFPAVPREEFMQTLIDYYDHPAHAALGGKEMVSSAYLISGGAYKYMGHAARLGADVFITGNFDEPAWHDAYERRINFLAMGHSATERVGPKALCEHLASHFKLQTSFIDVYNPF